MGTLIENLVNSGELSIETILSEAKEYCEGYFINPKGVIISTKYKKPRIIKQFDGGYKQRYKFAVLRLYGKSVNKYVHRLVAETFIDNHDNKEQVNHINGNQKDNRVENLEWVTPLENMKHAYENDLALRGENCPWTKLTNEDVIKCFNLHLEGKSQKYIRETLGMTKSQVNKIVKRVRWKHITEPLERATTIPNGSTQ